MIKQLAIHFCKECTNSYQIKSVQWLQKVGCLKKRAINLWSLTSWTFFCLRAPCRAKPLMGALLSSPSLFDCSAILNAGKVCASLYTGVSCAEYVHVMQSFRLRWTLSQARFFASFSAQVPSLRTGTHTHTHTHTLTRCYKTPPTLPHIYLWQAELIARDSVKPLAHLHERARHHNEMEKMGNIYE